jgi:hypothetical protein
MSGKSASMLEEDSQHYLQARRIAACRLSALGHKLPRPLTATVSAVPPKADIAWGGCPRAIFSLFVQKFSLQHV